MALMVMKDTISNKLQEAFTPESLQVVDESHLHEGLSLIHISEPTRPY